MIGTDLKKFTVNPVSVDIPRARFDRSTQLKTSFNAGDLVPIFVDEVLPGDTFSLDTASVVRMSTPIHPVMDNANIDMYYFYVPNRLVWSHWKEFMGENTQGPWASPVEYSIPQIQFVNGVKKGSIADYLGIPLTENSFKVNALPFRAYALIWNEWFRDQNTMTPVSVSLGDEDTVVTEIFGNDVSDTDYENRYVAEGSYGQFPLRVAKYHDYFTSALPMPQKGPAVSIGLGGEYPVIALDNYHDTINDVRLGMFGDPASSGWYQLFARAGESSSQPNGRLYLDNRSTSEPGGYKVNATNLGVNLDSGSAVSINLLRQAFQYQKMLERDARGGTRYTEIIKAHFGVTSPDSRQQRPEYLGGKRVPITVSQVLQTSSTDEVSPQGNTAAYSLTSDKGSSFTKSFTEHGYIIGLACVRTEHTYQQGIEKLWSRTSRLDFYDPVFANIGEQPIRNKEIYLTGDEEQDNEAFGYQEAWAEYRYKPSRVSGALRSTYAQSLDVWHYGDDFGELPTLSGKFIRETKVNVDRTLAVTSAKEDQFIADFYFRNICVRPMPVYSIPGLIDHH